MDAAPVEARPAGPPGALPSLRLTDVRKSFSGNAVLRGISLNLRGGEIVGLMGPNGAGKSTLLKVLDGFHRMDSGRIEVDGVQVPSLAGRSDVAFIHQDLGLVEDLSVTDNLRLGQPWASRFGPMIDRDRERDMAVAALRAVRLEVDPAVLIRDLPPGERTLVAIARALALGATKLFVDEATSNLTKADSFSVLAVLKELALDGALIVIVTHKLSEVFECAHRAVVLVDGELVADDLMRDLDRAALVSKLLAHETEAGLALATESTSEVGPEVIRFVNARTCKIGAVNLVVRRGEAVGLTGTAGSGLHEVALLAAGHAPLTAGAVEVDRAVRIALVPPQRETQGGFPALAVAQNMAISSLRRRRILAGLVSGARERADVEQMADELSVVPRSVTTEFGVLSGGNKQKVILGRALLTDPDLLVLCEPTRGVDIRTRAEIYRTVAKAKAAGAAVLVVSSDYEDLAAMCDRVGVVTAEGTSDPRPKDEVSLDQFEEYL
ncbi:D-ribose transporter ATP-binding protein [Pseudonocardia halophobica]|uniref:D-ribose transporter ATP-binding protein n=1 Tax=Pseudonocardia halophobica TaxID=29401 RepID=A0A9W6L6K6_9PSEU|nr:sugar ABC transporter ATP-binding protein [Pseudonocardia halophobica]GLL14028.1 D-ribose transporter ATP-binding protein [Pseudonocardia halophobica]